MNFNKFPSYNRTFSHFCKQRHQLKAQLDKYSDLYEPVQPNLDSMSLSLLTGAECRKGQ